MKIQVPYQNHLFTVDLSQPIDLSIPLGQVKCFYAPDLKITPYQSGDFIGSVKAGAPINFFDVQLNPHGNGTHTECVGHLTLEQQSVNQQLQEFHFMAKLISVTLEQKENGDQVITLPILQNALSESIPEALIIRTLPNHTDKLAKDYSGTNPPYIEGEAMEYIVQEGIKHLLIDLPSVDREIDGGKLNAHNIFWQTVGAIRTDCTITELIFIPNSVQDDLYFLNIQIASLELDASPSKILIYRLLS